MRIAVAAFPVEDGPDSLADWVEEAAENKAELLLFPEYAAIAQRAAHRTYAGSPEEICRSAAEAWGDFSFDIKCLAEHYRVWIAGASGPAKTGGRLVNRALIAAPDESEPLRFQDKLILTPWERANTPLAPGSGQTLVDLPWGRVSLLVCYDSEFPLLARRATAQGSKLLLIPACTDGPHGATRVRNAARARAQEGRCITAVAPLVGAAAGNPMIDYNTGRAGIYTPPDAGFPPDGILAEGAPDAPGWVYADLPPADTLAGQEVDIPAHWPESVDHAEMP